MLLDINDVCAMFATELMKLDDNENTLYVNITKQEMRISLDEVVRRGGDNFMRCVKTFGNNVVNMCHSLDTNFTIERPPNFNILRMQFIVYNRFVEVVFRGRGFDI